MGKNDTTAETLRRRAITFGDDGYNDQHVAVLRRAADELDVYELVTKSMQLEDYVAVVSDCRRMRQAIEHAYVVVKRLPMDQRLKVGVLKALTHALTARAEVGGSIRILAMQLGNANQYDPRPEVEARLVALLDRFYAEQEKTNGQENQGTEAATAQRIVSPAGDQRAEQSSADQRDHGAEGDGAGQRPSAGQAD